MQACLICNKAMGSLNQKAGKGWKDIFMAVDVIRQLVDIPMWLQANIPFLKMSAQASSWCYKMSWCLIERSFQPSPPICNINLSLSDHTGLLCLDSLQEKQALWFKQQTKVLDTDIEISHDNSGTARFTHDGIKLWIVLCCFVIWSLFHSAASKTIKQNGHLMTSGQHRNFAGRCPSC